MVRKTVTFDDDVASLLKEEMRQSGTSLKETVNRLLRLGLTASRHPAKKRFVVTPLAMGLPPGMSYDKVSELLKCSKDQITGNHSLQKQAHLGERRGMLILANGTSRET